jgi:predicted nucleic acid-binding protein
MFSRKDSLQRHEEVCLGKLKWYIKRADELEKELTDTTLEFEKELAKVTAERDVYKERCEVLDKKSTTTINNITNIKLEQVNISTIEPFTAETIRKRLEDYNFETFSKGYRGIVLFARSIIIKEDEKNYVVTDPSRNAFHRLIESRDWKKDPNGMFLDILLEELRPAIYNHYDHVMTIMKEARTEDEREDADTLMDKTKPVYFGARGDRGSKDREELRQKLRTDIKKLVTI